MTTTPAWIAQAKANDEQIREAIAVCETTINLGVRSWNQLIDERDRYVFELAGADWDKRRSIARTLVIIAQRIVYKADAIATSIEDLNALRRELRSVL